MATTFRNIRGDGNLIVPTVASLPTSAVTGTLAVDASTSDIYVFDGATWQLKTASGSAGVTSFNARTGVVLPASGDYGANQITNVPTSPITSTNVQDAIDELAAMPTTGTANSVAVYDNSGVLIASPDFLIDSATKGLIEYVLEEPNNESGTLSVNTARVQFEPLANSPNVTWNFNNIYAQLDNASSGFSQGTAGAALTLQNLAIFHAGTGDVGDVNLTKNYFGLGNGTDPIDVKGLSFSYGFGDINANVNMSGNIQGYGFQPSVNASATISSSTNIRSFYDGSNIGCASPDYVSYSAGPIIASIKNNQNYQGLTVSPNITTLTGGAGITGVSIFPTIGTINTGSFQGVSITPTVTLNNNYAVGVNVNMDSVTNYAGVQASLVVQDITYTMNTAGVSGNAIIVQYTDTVTAGNEVATFTGGNTITVSIESGVSTATQVLAALNANATIISNATITITGTASNPQTTYGPTNLAGGIDPGRKQAAFFKGDVEIQGALSFSGGLSIGALSSYATADLGVLPGGVNSIDTLVTAPSVAANATVSGKDLLGVNTAMLFTVGDNATVTTSFLGIAALGLPAVVNMGTGSTVDRIEGAVFAISLDATATGGTIAEVDLCRAVAIPNGSTTITKLKAYQFDLPFGDPGTTTFGIYMEPACHNYMAGDLKIGGTDTISNSSTGLELDSTTKAFLPSRMTTTQRDALTAVNGMVLYNSTTNKLQVYASGAWVDLH